MSAMISSNDAADPFAALCALERSCNPSTLAVTLRVSPGGLPWNFPEQALIFEMGEMLWALPRLWVREVIRQPRLTRIPNAAAELQGLINLRGILAPVLDLAVLLGLTGSTPAPAVVICLQQGRQIVGLSAHKVLGLRNMAAGLRCDIPAPGVACPHAWCGAVAWQPGLWAGVLDWPRLLAFSGVQDELSPE
jgi:chemotaxis signal transduction protein